MSDQVVIDLAAVREKRDGPDPEHRCRDGLGAPWFEFICHFVDDAGEQFGFTIWATDFEDAGRRIEALRRTAVVDGQLYSTVPL